MMDPSVSGESEGQARHASGGRSVAYLISRYPTLSMIFVLREVLALRQRGFRVETASINPPDRTADQLTEEERSEAARTYCLKRDGVPGAVLAHAWGWARHFGGYWRGLAMAFRLARLDVRRLGLNLAYFTEALMVGRWMRKNGQTHLHVHLASQAASVGLFAERVLGCGFSMTVHGPDEFADARGQYLAEKIAAANFLVCISAYTRSQLMNLSPYGDWAKMSVVRLGVDGALFSPERNGLRVYGQKAEKQDALEILCVGRLTPAKGQHLLIDAVYRLSQSGRSVRLRLVGSGPDETSLRACAAKIASPALVVLEGAVNQDRIRSLYEQADVFCLPSFAEGLPVVLMEAMAMGVPCVSTLIAGIPELIRNEVDGLLVPASDLDALTEALARLVDSRELRLRLATSARARVIELYDLGRNVAALGGVFLGKIG